MPSGGNVLLRGAELLCCKGLDNMLGRGSSLSQRKEPVLTVPAFICCFCCCCCGKGWGQRVCIMWGSLNRKELQEGKKSIFIIRNGCNLIWKSQRWRDSRLSLCCSPVPGCEKKALRVSRRKPAPGSFNIPGSSPWLGYNTALSMLLIVSVTNNKLLHGFSIRVSSWLILRTRPSAS